jgi:hypothetical protein
MKALEKFDVKLTKINNYGTFIQLVLFIVGWKSYKNNQQMIFYITIVLIVILVLITFYTLIRTGNKKNDLRSFIRNYFNSNEWKQLNDKAAHESLPLVGVSNRNNVVRDYLIQQATFYLLLNKQYLTFQQANDLITELIKDDNKTDLLT